METRVLHLITRFLDGGAEKTTRNTLEALETKKYDLRLGTGIEHDQDKLKELEEQGFEIIVFRFIRHYNPFAAILAVVEVAIYLHREDIDVLHTHSTEAGIIGRIAGFLAGTPNIIHEVHGDPISEDRSHILNVLIIALERLCARFADRIIVKSELIRETFLQRGVGHAEQYEIIFHGVDLECFQNEIVVEDREKGQIIFVGRLAKGKGINDLLEAIQGLSDIEVKIVGDGPQYDQLEKVIREKELPAELLGYREDIEELMAQADIFVLPSYREGTPRVITEAQASGLPVIATDIAGIPEQVQSAETGFLIRPGDKRALAYFIDKLMSSPKLRREMGEKAKDNVEDFSIVKAQQSFRDLYEQIR